MFTDRPSFEAHIAAGGFLEWTEFLGSYYGTPEPEAPEGHDVVLEIELHGAQQVRERHPEALLVFVLPPSRAEQERRLRGRGDSPERIQARLTKAEQEEPVGVALADAVVTNDDLQATVAALARLIDEERANPLRHP